MINSFSHLPFVIPMEPIIYIILTPTTTIFNIQYPHFINLKTDTQRGDETCPRPLSLGLEFNHRQFKYEACALSEGSMNLSN